MHHYRPVARALLLWSAWLLASVVPAVAGESAPAGLELRRWWLLPRVGAALSRTTPAERTRAVDGALSDIDALVLRDPAPPVREDEAFTLQSSATSAESADARALFETGERWHLARFTGVVASRRLDAKLSAYGQLGYVPRDGERSAMADHASEPGTMGVKGEIAGVELGAEYRSVGKRLDGVLAVSRGMDEEGPEVWVAPRLGFLRLRLSHSDLTDNVDRDTARPRTRRAQTAVKAEAVLDAWPIFGVTYAIGDLERLRPRSDGRSNERREFNNVTASAYHRGSGWELTLASTLGHSRDPDRMTEDATAVYQYLSLSLTPIDSLSVTPAIGVGQERADASGIRTDTTSASLLLTYYPRASRWSGWTMAAYSTTQTSDATVDARSVSVSAGLAYDLGRVLTGRASVVLDAAYDRYLDGAAPTASARAVSVLLSVRLASF
jgi:hypothetical protein